MLCERPVNDGSLDAHAAPVDESYLGQAGGLGLAEVLLDHRGNVAGLERVKVELPFDGDPDGFLVHYASASKTAVTDVERPPRTEKSPTTVMRRGRHTATRSSRIWLVTAS